MDLLQNLPPEKRWFESASHVPVLVLIPKLFKIKRVLEIGAGELSTFLFLDRQIYPELTELTSVEDSFYWSEKMSSFINDSRWVLSHKEIPQDGFDLVFIDGPQEVERRQQVLSSIGDGLTAVHDFDDLQYSKKVTSRLHKFIFDFVKPWSALLSDKPLPIELDDYNDIMSVNFEVVDANWRRWSELL